MFIQWIGYEKFSPSVKRLGLGSYGSMLVANGLELADTILAMLVEFKSPSAP
jgi:hypothetical protein